MIQVNCMSKDKPKWWKHMHLDDRVIIEYNKGIFRGKPTIMEGTVYGINKYHLRIIPEGRYSWENISYDSMCRLKNLDTDYDSGEAHE